MSDVSLGLSGGWPQQLDSLISNSTWMGDTGRQGDFLFMHSERRKALDLLFVDPRWGPFQNSAAQERGAQATERQIHPNITQTFLNVSSHWP